MREYYYIFRSDLVEWYDGASRAEILRAKPLEDALAFQEYVMDYSRHWWDAQPVDQPPLLPVSFAVNTQAPLLDNYFTGTLFNLYSARLIRMLKNTTIRFEVFPATLVDSETGMILIHEYYIFHLLEKYNVIDELVEEWKLHHGQVGNPIGQPERRTEDTPNIRRLLFRLEDAALVVIHKDLKTILEEAGITGCLYEHYGWLKVLS